MMQSAGGEALRQRYLAAMGITPWLPTRALPGAAPSPRWCWQTLAPDVTPSAPAAVPSAAPVPSSAAAVQPPAPRPRLDVKALLGSAVLDTGQDNPQDATARGSEAPQPVVRSADVPTAAPAPQIAEIPRFRLWIQRYPRCLVVNDLPLDPQQPVTPQHQRLLQAILAAVNLDAGEAVGGILSWPMFAPESGHDQGIDVARLMLREEAGLAVLPDDAPLLLLGEQAALLLGSAGGDKPAGGARIIGPSLNEMLRIPARKAELWRQLQPLRRR